MSLELRVENNMKNTVDQVVEGRLTQVQKVNSSCTQLYDDMLMAGVFLIKRLAVVFGKLYLPLIERA